MAFLTSYAMFDSLFAQVSINYVFAWSRRTLLLQLVKTASFSRESKSGWTLLMTLSVSIFDIVTEWLCIGIALGCPVGRYWVPLTETRRTSQRYAPCPVLETYVILIAARSRTLVRTLSWSMGYRVCNFGKRAPDFVLIWCRVIFFMILNFSSIGYVISRSAFPHPKFDSIAIRTGARWGL